MTDKPFKYIVTIDRPYYPSVDYFTTLKEARRFFKEEIKDIHSEDGQYDVKICIAKVISFTEIKTSY